MPLLNVHAEQRAQAGNGRRVDRIASAEVLTDRHDLAELAGILGALLGDLIEPIERPDGPASPTEQPAPESNAAGGDEDRTAAAGGGRSRIEIEPPAETWEVTAFWEGDRGKENRTCGYADDGRPLAEILAELRPLMGGKLVRVQFVPTPAHERASEQGSTNATAGDNRGNQATADQVADCMARLQLLLQMLTTTNVVVARAGSHVEAGRPVYWQPARRQGKQWAQQAEKEIAELQQENLAALRAGGVVQALETIAKGRPVSAAAVQHQAEVLRQALLELADHRGRRRYPPPQPGPGADVAALDQVATELRDIAWQWPETDTLRIELEKLAGRIGEAIATTESEGADDE